MLIRSIVALVAAILLAPAVLADEATDKALEALQGTWTIVSFTSNGEEVAAGQTAGWQRIVKGTHVEWKDGDMVFLETDIQIGPTNKPMTLDSTIATGDAKGRTLYRLSPETADHLLCKSAACLGEWPPLTVGSRSAKLAAGSGVHGKLALISRGKNRFQVTLGGKPLYRFAGDSDKGQVHGEGLKDFGGTWHTLSAGKAPAAAPKTPTNPTPTTPTNPTPGYDYPSTGY